MERKIFPVRKSPASAGNAASAAKKIFASKKIAIILVQFLVMGFCLFAGDKTGVSATIIEKMNIVMGILYSPWVKALFGIVVGFKAVSFIINHEQGTFKKLIPLAGAALIYFLAPKVADALVGNDSYEFNTSDGTVTEKKNN